jgi:non-homologous end joining protein Ku
MPSTTSSSVSAVLASSTVMTPSFQRWDDDLLGMTLRYPYELKNAKDYFYDIADVKIDPKLLTLAQHIPKTKEARFDPTRFVDRYEQAVVEMLERKQAGEASRWWSAMDSNHRFGLPYHAVTILPETCALYWPQVWHIIA